MSSNEYAEILPSTAQQDSPRVVKLAPGTVVPVALAASAPERSQRAEPEPVIAPLRTPPAFVCPLTRTIMADPHLTVTGDSFEYQAIRRWFAKGHRTHPITKERFKSLDLIPNKALKQQIQEWKQDNAAALELQERETKRKEVQRLEQKARERKQAQLVKDLRREEELAEWREARLRAEAEERAVQEAAEQRVKELLAYQARRRASGQMLASSVSPAIERSEAFRAKDRKAMRKQYQDFCSARARLAMRLGRVASVFERRKPDILKRMNLKEPDLIRRIRELRRLRSLDPTGERRLVQLQNELRANPVPHGAGVVKARESKRSAGPEVPHPQYTSKYGMGERDEEELLLHGPEAEEVEGQPLLLGSQRGAYDLSDAIELGEVVNAPSAPLEQDLLTEGLRQLRGMGFSEAQGRVALLSHQLCVEDAVNQMLDERAKEEDAKMKTFKVAASDSTGVYKTKELRAASQGLVENPYADHSHRATDQKTTASSAVSQNPYAMVAQHSRNQTTAADAKTGVAEAERTLREGLVHFHGLNFQRVDEERGKRLIIKAAQLGSLCALGECHYEGWGHSQDFAEAVACYERAVNEQGSVAALNCLGVCYSSGSGVREDLEKSAQLFTQAAQQGDAQAQNNLAHCYYHEEGVLKDYEQAAAWYDQAAKQGHVNAQFNLAMCFYYGRGVEKNTRKAAFFWRQAARQEHPSAASVLKKVCAKHPELNGAFYEPSI